MPQPHDSDTHGSASEGPTAQAAVQDIDGIGRFFSMVSLPGTPTPSEANPWRPLEDVWSAGVLGVRIEDTRHLFAQRVGTTAEEVEPRVAASVLYQGLAARLVSPAMGTAVLHGVIPNPAALRWRTAPHGPLPLLLAEDRGIPAPCGPEHGPETAAEVINRVIVLGLLEPAATSFRAQVKLSPRVLRGNLASSVAGAARRIEAMRPEAGPAAHALAEALISLPPLTGEGIFGEPRPVLRRSSEAGLPIRFRRNSCCLYYRLPTGGKCADCVLLHNTESAR